jgi:hypothetical protein
MAHARILFEYDGLVYAVGPVRLGIALRAASSREFSLLRPFPTAAAAERMRAAMARAQVVEFSGNEAARIDGLQKRRRRTRRRRRVLRMPVELASMLAARPSAPLRPSERSSPSVSPRSLPRRVSPADRRPSPEVVAELNAAMDQLETRSE